MKLITLATTLFILSSVSAYAMDSEHSICIVMTAKNNDDIYIGCNKRINEQDQFYPIRSDNWEYKKIGKLYASKLDPTISTYNGMYWFVGATSDSHRVIYNNYTGQQEDPLISDNWRRSSFSSNFDKSDQRIHAVSDGRNLCFAHSGVGSSNEKMRLTCTKDMNSIRARTDSDNFEKKSPNGFGDSNKPISAATDGIRWCVSSNGGGGNDKIYLTCNDPLFAQPITSPIYWSGWGGNKLGPAGESKKHATSIATDGRRWCVVSGGGSNSNKKNVYIACTKKYYAPYQIVDSSWETAQLPVGESKKAPSIATDGIRWCVTTSGGSNSNDKMIYLACTKPYSSPTNPDNWKSDKLGVLGESKRAVYVGMSKSCYHAGEKADNVNQCCRGLSRREGICVPIIENLTPPEESDAISFTIQGNGKDAHLPTTQIDQWKNTDAYLTAFEAVFTSNRYLGSFSNIDSTQDALTGAAKKRRDEIKKGTDCLNAKYAILEEATKLNEELKDLPASNHSNIQKRAPLIEMLRGFINLTDLNQVKTDLTSRFPGTLSKDATGKEYSNLKKLFTSSETSLNKTELGERVIDTLTNKCLYTYQGEMRCNNETCNYDEFQLASLAIAKKMKKSQYTFFQRMLHISNQFDEDLLVAQQMGNNEDWVCQNAAIQYCGHQAGFKVAMVDNHRKYWLYIDPIIHPDFPYMNEENITTGILWGAILPDKYFMGKYKDWITTTSTYFKNYQDSYGKENPVDNLGELSFEILENYSKAKIDDNFINDGYSRTNTPLLFRTHNLTALNYFHAVAEISQRHMNDLDETYRKFNNNESDVIADSTTTQNTTNYSGPDLSNASNNELHATSGTPSSSNNLGNINTSIVTASNSRIGSGNALPSQLGTSQAVGQNGLTANGSTNLSSTTTSHDAADDIFAAAKKRLKGERENYYRKKKETNKGQTNKNAKDGSREGFRKFVAKSGTVHPQINGATVSGGKLSSSSISSRSNTNNETTDDKKTDEVEEDSNSKYNTTAAESDDLDDDKITKRRYGDDEYDNDDSKDSKTSSGNYDNDELSGEETEAIFSHIDNRYEGSEGDTIWTKVSKAYVRNYNKVLHKKGEHKQEKIKAINLGKPMEIK